MADALDCRRHAGTQGRMNAVLQIRIGVGNLAASL